ncbi:ATPase, T2SS/T4P/T4SS family [Paracraurococcus lichenis]|uniref:ATPase, T2SS/T4P/T4SS family n=1 Tax=Paracraurococcus lichenis TaxID=3064888 RepID=A0ABT9EAH8_9PROT|nr:ATPase, T2SS/T4P/T4SS family [Paracraurococcus sp. LOR1-02]MDO9713199.1 ATPase, T2SS/T4P/T4SS family [Paracraurococcus sp. LOR1-02]
MSETLELDPALERDALDTAVEPIAPLLAEGEDVAVNTPGEAWHYLGGQWHRHAIPALTEARCRGIALLAEAQTRPAVRQRIISTDMPSGHRLEALLPPVAMPHTVILSFRRGDEQVPVGGELGKRFQASQWNRWGSQKAQARAAADDLLALFDTGDMDAFLAGFARRRLTPVFCGDTGAGKTYVLKSYAVLLPEDARICVIEDAREAVLRQPNHVRMLFKRGGAAPLDLLRASLRLRPDYVVLQELRDAEASWVFLNDCMAGHPGSPTTIHGGTAQQAVRRLFSNIQASEEARGMDGERLIEFMETAIELIVPIQNSRGVRSFGDVWFAPDALRRGKTLRDLIGGND